MLKIASQGTTSNLINKRLLKKVKMKALRNGAWFRALHRIDRVLIDLTMKVADNVCSVTLAKSILAVIKKLEENIGSGLSRALRDIGFSLARKLSLLAQRWGNTSAKKWVLDISFFRFLAVLHINDPRYSKHNRLCLREYWS
jgi:hypothetical protein